jgi:hypothetical protein
LDDSFDPIRADDLKIVTARNPIAFKRARSEQLANDDAARNSKHRVEKVEKAARRLSQIRNLRFKKPFLAAV